MSRHGEDFYRTLRGVALVLSSAAADSPVLKRSADDVAAASARALKHLQALQPKGQETASATTTSASIYAPSSNVDDRESSDRAVPGASPSSLNAAHACTNVFVEGNPGTSSVLYNATDSNVSQQHSTSLRGPSPARGGSGQSMVHSLAAPIEGIAFRTFAPFTSNAVPHYPPNYMQRGLHKKHPAGVSAAATLRSFSSPSMAEQHPATTTTQDLPQQAQNSTHIPASNPPKQKAKGAPVARRKFRERAVPSSQVGRAIGFAGLGAGMMWGAATESVARAFGPRSEQPAGNPFLSERNAELFANGLCRMRGAALKIGQMLSIQDEDMMPPQVAAALERVRQSADVMPRRQLESTLQAELGKDWHSKLASFDWEPSAAASIGQVHKAELHDGRTVAVKIQYPGVANSIESDVDNLMRLLSLANVFPRGLYVEEAARVAKKELALECDYRNEARHQQHFRSLMTAESPDFQSNFVVPDVIPQLSSRHVLCSEWVPGVAVDSVKNMEADIRDRVGTLLLQLTLKELFQWRFMQTDPNWGNFLYDEDTGKLSLIDFGAARDFPKPFVDDYLQMVMACSKQDFPEVIHRSKRLGFLTGEESQVMLDAHCHAGAAVGTPFGHEGVYDFGSHNQLTKRVSQLGSTMVKHRLTAPPEDAYSLHRRLSGAFLVNIKLKAKVPCQKLFYEVYDQQIKDISSV